MLNWKKTMMPLGLVALTCFGWSVILAGGVLVDDDFKKANVGEKPAGYVVEESNGKVSVVDSPVGAGKCLFLDDLGSANIKVTKKFAPQTGVVTAELSFMQPSLGSTAKVLRLLDGSGNNAAVHIETKSGMISYKNADGTFVSLVSYTEKAWYKITVVADVKTQKADVYINGEQKVSQGAFTSKVAEIAALDSYTPGSSAKGHFLANLKVVEGGTAKAPESKPATEVQTQGAGLIADLAVKDASSANLWSIQTNLQNNDRQFGDRQYTISKLPAEYVGYDWIRTAADSKNFNGDVVATFKVTKDADVFVAIDYRVAVKPEWLANWSDTKTEFINSDSNVPRFLIYKKHFAANSTVTLGPNGQRSGCIFYTVIVKGPDKPKVTAEKKPEQAPVFVKATWKGILGMDPEWFKTPEAIRIADNVLLFQRNSGGWYKYRDHSEDEYNIAVELTAAEKEKYQKDKVLDDATIDNGSTYTHLRYLARVYNATKLERFKTGFVKGLDFLLKAQYPSGGWPQYYPDKTLYRAHITYNDDAMINVLILMRQISSPANPDFKFVDAARRKSATVAVNKGINCVLKTQIRVKGKLTAWCAQHDEKNLAPAPARAYELESISGSESLGIIRFLMSLENPGVKVKQAVHSAIAWLDASKMTGIQVVEKNDVTKAKGFDKVVVENPKAPLLWARFYEIATNRPFFCGRDGVKKYSLSEVEYERRVGYTWYTEAPTNLLLKEYPEWQQKWDPKRNVLK